METQKTILITGCSSGIGLQTAIYLAGKGHRVYASMRDTNKKTDLVEAARTAKVSVGVVKLDVTDEKSIKSAVGSILKKEGRIDVLVNNAGYGLGGFIEDISLDEMRAQFETNVFGLVRVTQEVLPSMRRERKGTIINISSVVGKVALPIIGMYSASKFAVEAITDSMRIELSPFGIKVTAVEPGEIKTNFGTSMRMAKKSKNPASPYFEYTKRFNDMDSRNGDSPLAVVKAIEAAINSDSPKSRYVAGRDARKFLAMKAWLPDSTIESMIKKMFFG